MSKIPENVFKEIINYPFLYDQTNPDYADSRKCCWAWEQIAKTRWNTEWTNLTLSEKTKKVHDMQKAWKSSQEKKYLETWIKRYQSENSVVQETNSVETPTSQIRAVSTNNDDSTRDRNMEKELLVLYLLPIYKLLKEEDKQEILHKCYRVMKERQQQSEDQPNAM